MFSKGFVALILVISIILWAAPVEAGNQYCIIKTVAAKGSSVIQNANIYKYSSSSSKTSIGKTNSNGIFKWYLPKNGYSTSIYAEATQKKLIGTNTYTRYLITGTLNGPFYYGKTYTIPMKFTLPGYSDYDFIIG